MAKATARRTIAEKIPFGWVTADAAYSFDRGWPFELEQADVCSIAYCPAQVPLDELIRITGSR